MKKLLVLIVCFLIVTPGYSDHYTQTLKSDKWQDLEEAVVLITTEISQDVRQPSENPFDKFLQPDTEDKTRPAPKILPDESSHEANEDEPAPVPSGMGTGFFIDQYHIVTNYHVVKERNGKADIKVYSYNHIIITSYTPIY